MSIRFSYWDLNVCLFEEVGCLNSWKVNSVADRSFWNMIFYTWSVNKSKTVHLLFIQIKCVLYFWSFLIKDWLFCNHFDCTQGSHERLKSRFVLHFQCLQLLQDCAQIAYCECSLRRSTSGPSISSRHLVLFVMSLFPKWRVYESLEEQKWLDKTGCGELISGQVKMYMNWE